MKWRSSERSHRWPDFLPGGKAALFSIAYEVGNPLDDAAVAVTTFAGWRARFLVLSTVDDQPPPITVVTGWANILRH